MQGISYATAETTENLALRLTRPAGEGLHVGLLHCNVQGVADDNPENAGSIIESSGMNVKKKGSYTKPDFAVKPGRVRGSVRLEVRSAGDRGGYEWAWSIDGGKTWLTRATTQTSTDIDGLPSGVTCLFRYRVTTPREGTGNWSEAVEFLVR